MRELRHEKLPGTAFGPGNLEEMEGEHEILSIV
jgi:hypothetical protein